MNNPSAPSPNKAFSRLAVAGMVCCGLLLVAAFGGFLLAGKSGLPFSKPAGDAQSPPERIAASATGTTNPGVKPTTVGEVKIKFGSPASGLPAPSAAVGAGDPKKPNADAKMIEVNGPQAVGVGAVVKSPSVTDTVINAPGSRRGDWLIYPGLAQEAAPTVASNVGVHAGAVIGTTRDSVEAVTDYYKAKLKENGMHIDTLDVFKGADSSGASIVGTGTEGKTSVNISINGASGGATQIAVNYQEPK